MGMKHQDSKRLFSKQDKRAHKEMRKRRRDKSNRNPMPMMA